MPGKTAASLYDQIGGGRRQRRSATEPHAEPTLQIPPPTPATIDTTTSRTWVRAVLDRIGV
jgi:hypothetical protein